MKPNHKALVVLAIMATLNLQALIWVGLQASGSTVSFADVARTVNTFLIAGIVARLVSSKP